MRNVVLAFVFVLVSSSESFAEEFETIDHIPSRSQIENFGSSLNAADASAVRPITPLTLDLIKDFEGWEPKAYNDPSGYCTIGYGHLIALKKCQQTDLMQFKNKVLTTDEGEAILQTDTVFARRSVQNLINSNIDLSDDQFGALSAFVFNVGEANFLNSTMLVLLNDDHISIAAGQFGRWIKSKGVALEGLRKRRACEKKFFEEELSYGDDGNFSRKTCENYQAAGDAAADIDIEDGE